MWDRMPATLRKLFGMPPVQTYRHYVEHTWEWPLYSMAMYRLGLSLDLAYQIMDGGPLPRLFRYRHFTVPKKDGTVREIVEPGPSLKAVQRRILRFYLDKPRPHAAALGFRRKKSIADHAWAHAGAAIIITADIQDFFPNTTRQRVKAWWHAQGYGTLEMRLLTSLTTYRGSLPQGAPTSPTLSNLVNYEMDAALDRRLRQSGGTYTRYSDDLVFSWPDGYGPPAEFEHSVRALLRQSGYTLHPRKGWHVWNRRDEPQVTGVILKRHGDVDIPDSMLRIMRALSDSRDPLDQARYAGYQGYRTMVTREPSSPSKPESSARRPANREKY
jgi:RNA-directed DNA polymerase